MHVKSDLYPSLVKDGWSILNFYESSACLIIFYNVFSDIVNNLYESILLIISFLFFSVGKVLVANEKISEIMVDVNIFVEDDSGTTEKFLNEVLVYYYCERALIGAFVNSSIARL